MPHSEEDCDTSGGQQGPAPLPDPSKGECYMCQKVNVPSLDIPKHFVYATISTNKSQLLYSIAIYGRLGDMPKWMIDQNFVKPISEY